MCTTAVQQKATAAWAGSDGQAVVCWWAAWNNKTQMFFWLTDESSVWAERKIHT